MVVPWQGGGMLSRTGGVAALTKCLLVAVLLGRQALETKAQTYSYQVDDYPQTALKCFSTMTMPDQYVICPEFRTTYCVKETIDLAREDCGRTDFFGDMWNSETKACEYRKCASTCEDASWDYEFEGIDYQRDRFCCQENYCNSASPSRDAGRLSVVLGASLIALLTLGGMGWVGCVD